MAVALLCTGRMVWFSLFAARLQVSSLTPVAPNCTAQVRNIVSCKFNDHAHAMTFLVAILSLMPCATAPCAHCTTRVCVLTGSCSLPSNHMVVRKSNAVSMLRTPNNGVATLRTIHAKACTAVDVVTAHAPSS